MRQRIANRTGKARGKVNSGIDKQFTALQQEIADRIEETLGELPAEVRHGFRALRNIYDIGMLVADRDKSLAKKLQIAVELLPETLLYFEGTGARINFGDKVFTTSNFVETGFGMTAPIPVDAEQAGTIEVFLPPEQVEKQISVDKAKKWLNTIGKMLGAIIEKDRFLKSLIIQCEHNFRALVHNANDGIIMFADDGKVLYKNRRATELFGRNHTITKSANLRRYIRSEELDEILKKVEEKPASKVRFAKKEVSLKRSDGVELTIELVVAKTVWHGEIVNFGILRNISEQARETGKMQSYLDEITKAQERERKRLARELHDGTSQLLGTLALKIDSVLRDSNELSGDTIRRLKMMRADTELIMEQVRGFTHRLRPEVLDQMGLVPALEALAKQFNESGQIHAFVDVAGQENRLAPEIELELFRIAQEALNNIRKHSEAKSAIISIRFSEAGIRLIIKDDGKGFKLPNDVNALVSQGKMGLTYMKERCRLIEAHLVVKSSAGRGTAIRVEVGN